MLKEFGISSEWVLSGEEALIKIAEAHSNESDYDAVIVDWKMPVMDGLETTRQIRRIMGDAIPIIILTAYDWEEIAEAAKNMGVNTFLTKPLFRSHLYHVILQIMTGKQADKVDERTDTLVGTNTLKGHVLLVEDNELNMKIAEEFIKMNGVSMEKAWNGIEALKLFAQKTTNVLDFGCGTGDISFQYLQYQPTHKVLGIDASKTGIEFATETARLSDYKTATFLEGTDHTVKQLEENSFDGVILSNVLDVMPKDVSKEVVEDLERVLKPGGYWFIKMNPYYSKEELESFGYENMGNNIYEENHVMRLRQATTNYWKERFTRFGKEIIYLEFEYPWQEGMNRLFVYQS